MDNPMKTNMNETEKTIAASEGERGAGTSPPPATTAEGPATPPPRDARGRVLDGYRASALDAADANVALAGAVNAGLAEIAFRFEDAISARMEASPPTIESLERLQRVVQTYLQITRQIDRNLNLQQLIQEREAKSLAETMRPLPKAKRPR